MVQVQTNISVDPKSKQIAVNVWCLEREDCNDHERSQAKNVERIVASLFLSAAKAAGYEVLEANFINKTEKEAK